MTDTELLNWLDTTVKEGFSYGNPPSWVWPIFIEKKSDNEEAPTVREGIISCKEYRDKNSKSTTN